VIVRRRMLTFAFVSLVDRITSPLLRLDLRKLQIWARRIGAGVIFTGGRV